MDRPSRTRSSSPIWASAGIDLYSLTLLDAAGATIYSRTGTLIAGNIVVQR